MVAEILAIGNPSKRRRKLTSKQIAAGFGGKRRKISAKRNPTKRRRKSKPHVRRVRRNPTAASAPTRRSSSRGRRRHSFAVRRRAAATKYRRFRKRASGANITTIDGFINNALVPAGIGAAGALALDVGWGSLPLPDALKTGPLAPVVRVGGAVAIGVVAGLVAGKKWGAAAMLGALTVTTYDMAKGFLAANAPALPGLSAYPMGAYPGMGYVNPAPVNSFYG